MKKIIHFIKSIKTELKKVTWISGEKLVKLTLVVLSVSVVMGLVLQLIDIGLQYLIKNYL